MARSKALTNQGLYGNWADPKTQASFVFFSAKVLREFRETFAEEFCNFDGRSGFHSLCISAMILVALQNNSLIDEIGEIYLFCIYFSLNNFNYPKKKLAISSN